MEKSPGQITMQELNPVGVVLKKKHHWNLLYHYYAVNEIRHKYGFPMICTSGVRSRSQQLFTYAKINHDRILKGLEPVETPMNSPHLIGAASDWSDPFGHLYDFLVASPNLVEELDLYIEDKAYTPKHTHIQTVPVASGTRFFKPY